MVHRTLPTHAQLVGAPIAGAVPLRRPTSRLARLGRGLLAVVGALWELYLIFATAAREVDEERERERQERHARKLDPHLSKEQFHDKYGYFRYEDSGGW